MTQSPTPELPDDLQVPRWRYWGDRRPPKNRADMFRVENAAPSEGGEGAGSSVGSIRIYAPIDSWGGFFGVSTKDVSAALDELGDVAEIRVRINSPGGEVPEAMAILNMLRAHSARITAVVDGLAASSASFLAAGADETVMSPGTQMMVHDASGFAFGDAGTMDKAKRMLDSASNSIASIYAEATGETAEDWRAVMRAETWYTADEAVEAGLADRVGIVAEGGETAHAGEDSSDIGEVIEETITDRFDLSVFNYAGRTHAPAPKPPSASAVGSTHTEGGSAVAFSDEQLTTMRQKLGIAEDADEATILAALDEALEERSEPTPTAPAAPAPTAQAATPPADPAPDTQPAAAATPGTMVIDSSAWEKSQQRIRALESQDAKRRVEERDKVIDQAVADGKFEASRKDHWKRVWDADPEGTRAVIDSLTKNVIPVAELGHATDDGDFDEFAHLFPKGD